MYTVLVLGDAALAKSLQESLKVFVNVEFCHNEQSVMLSCSVSRPDLILAGQLYHEQALSLAAKFQHLDWAVHMLAVLHQEDTPIEGAFSRLGIAMLQTNRVTDEIVRLLNLGGRGL
jgi:PleD family two-component response regulator